MTSDFAGHAHWRHYVLTDPCRQASAFPRRVMLKAMECGASARKLVLMLAGSLCRCLVGAERAFSTILHSTRAAAPWRETHPRVSPGDPCVTRRLSLEMDSEPSSDPRCAGPMSVICSGSRDWDEVPWPPISGRLTLDHTWSCHRSEQAAAVGDDQEGASWKNKWSDARVTVFLPFSCSPGEGVSPGT